MSVAVAARRWALSELPTTLRSAKGMVFFGSMDAPSWSGRSCCEVCTYVATVHTPAQFFNDLLRQDVFPPRHDSTVDKVDHRRRWDTMVPPVGTHSVPGACFHRARAPPSPALQLPPGASSVRHFLVRTICVFLLSKFGANPTSHVSTFVHAFSPVFLSCCGSLIFSLREKLNGQTQLHTSETSFLN